MGREREDGHVYFTGGLVAFPGVLSFLTLLVAFATQLIISIGHLIGFYLLSKKINKSLETVHNPVPYFNEKLLMSVERTLKRFKPDEPFERTSWEIVDDRNLFYRLFFHRTIRLFMEEINGCCR